MACGPEKWSLLSSTPGWHILECNFEYFGPFGCNRFWSWRTLACLPAILGSQPNIIRPITIRQLSTGSNLTRDLETVRKLYDHQVGILRPQVSSSLLWKFPWAPEKEATWDHSRCWSFPSMTDIDQMKSIISFDGNLHDSTVAIISTYCGKLYDLGSLTSTYL